MLVLMATKKRGLLQRLFGSKKMSFDDSMDTEDEDVATLQVFQTSTPAFGRRHTVDVETFRRDMSDEALMAAASKRAAERQRSDGYTGPLHQFFARVRSHAGDSTPIAQRRISLVSRFRTTKATTKPTTKPPAKPAKKPAPPPRTTPIKTENHRHGSELGVDNDDDLRRLSGSFRRRISRRDRLLRFGALCKVDTSQPIVYPTTPETILEYHKAMPFLDENEEWLMVELNEYECLVDSIEIIRIIAKHSKFFEVEPDELWEEFFEFVDDVPAYDEVINFDVWQEFRDKKYTC